MPMKKKSDIQIFLAHAHEDKKEVSKLYAHLKEAGYKPWMDKEDLLCGKNWREEIPKAIENSQFFIACLSQKSISKEGYVQKEFKYALNKYAEMPTGTIYIIPLRLEQCDIPAIQQAKYGLDLRELQWLDYWEDDGLKNLERAFNHQYGPFEKKFKKVPDPNKVTLDGVKLCTKNMNYTKLRDLLSAGNWKEADHETLKVMCQVAGRENEGKLYKEDTDNFPCEDLLIINQLWLYYSDGKFGFSVQKKIYENLLRTRFNNWFDHFIGKFWNSFCDILGWKEELNFDLENAREGHLPAIHVNGVWRWDFSSLKDRLGSCK